MYELRRTQDGVTTVVRTYYSLNGRFARADAHNLAEEAKQNGSATRYEAVLVRDISEADRNALVRRGWGRPPGGGAT